MIPIGWLLIYDVIYFGSRILTTSFSFLFGETLSITYILQLFRIIKDLSKAENPTKYKESTDWFFEKKDN